jgi:hypothetical protein
MTKAEVKEMFIAEGSLGYIMARYSPDDDSAIRQQWHAFTNDLVRIGEMTEAQYHNWTLPNFTDRDKLRSLIVTVHQAWDEFGVADV